MLCSIVRTFAGASILKDSFCGVSNLAAVNSSDLLAGYDRSALTLCSIGSHSALEVAYGARAQGLRNLVVTAGGREKTYTRYYARRADPSRGCVDETLELAAFPDLLKDDVQRKLRERNVIFLANRSFEVYLHQKFSYDEIERGMLVPMFGNRRLLRAEERDEENNQYALLARAGIRHPRQFRTRVFSLFVAGGVSRNFRALDARRHAVGGRLGRRRHRGIRAGSVGQLELLLFAGFGRARVMRNRHAAANQSRGLSQRTARSVRGAAKRSDAIRGSRPHCRDPHRVDARNGVRHGGTVRKGRAGSKSAGGYRAIRITVHHRRGAAKRIRVLRCFTAHSGLAGHEVYAVFRVPLGARRFGGRAYCDGSRVCAGRRAVTRCFNVSAFGGTT